MALEIDPKGVHKKRYQLFGETKMIGITRKETPITRARVAMNWRTWNRAVDRIVERVVIASLSSRGSHKQTGVALSYWLLLPLLAGCAAPSDTLPDVGSDHSFGERRSSEERLCGNRAELEEYVGHYESESGATYVVTFSANEELLLFDRTNGDLWAFTSARGDTFESPRPDREYTLEFKRDMDQRITRATFDRATEETLALTKRSVDAQIRELAYRNDEVTLVGTRYSPSSSGKLPAIVLVHGSGYSDRDSPWYQLVALTFLDRGFVVLLPDKRGSGRSGGVWQEANFSDYAEDAIAAVRRLRMDQSIDSERIGVVGMSQGGWVVPLAATKSDLVSFVINLSGSAVRPEEQVMHEVRQTLKMSGVDGSDIETIMEWQEMVGVFLETGEGAERYRKRYDELMTTDLAPVVADFPADLTGPTIEWWKGIYNYDPLPHWRDINVPALIIYGREDEQDNVPVGESVQRLIDIGANDVASDITVHVIDGTGHALLSKGTQVGLHEEVIQALDAWLKKYSTTSR